MRKYDEQYYIAFNNYDNETLYLKTLRKSTLRRPGRVKLTFGDEPLFFQNAYKNDDKLEGVKILPSKAHMNLGRIIVNTELYRDLVQFDIRNFQLYPSVIIDDDENHHDGYWFFNYYDRLPAIDFENSVIDDYDPSNEEHSVDKYSLSNEVLDAIPEEERLIFIPSGADVEEVFVHQKIVDIFNAHKVDTIVFYKVSEWEMGEQF
ncbi:imm11 family protein [Photobacterium nomapromontoriensis]|uniref:imm11 family protein n=1 Tax=Photobacterium nomapromontoriensis TaxID=2910237 RepID=UPI003D0A3326